MTRVLGGRSSLTRTLVAIATLHALAGSVLTSTLPARAGEPRKGTPPDARAAQRCPAPLATSGAADAENDDAALFARYRCWLELGEYRSALEALERACRGSDDAACSFNRALVHHAWLALPGELDREHCDMARRDYARYLTLEPYEEQSDAARSALLELDAICEPRIVPAPRPLAADPSVIPPLDAPPLDALPLHASSAPANPEPSPADAANAVDAAAANSAPRATSAPERPLEPEHPRPLPWLLLGAGSASAFAASLSWIAMSRADADLARHAQSGVVYASTETRARDSSRRRYRDWVWGFGSGAAVLLGAGTTLLLLEPSLPPALSLDLGPGSGVVGYAGSF